MASKGTFGAGRNPKGSFNIFKDDETDWIFKRTLGYMYEKAAETRECLYAARRINEKDGESWIKEWSELASRVEQMAEESLSKGNKVSAREAFWRASNYYRTAESGTPVAHPRFHELWEKSVKTFRKSCPLFYPPIQIIDVPFEGKKLPGYYMRPDNSDVTRPTLIAIGGTDSSAEEICYTGSCLEAVRRGYNFFTYDFPGHRGAVHLYPDCVKRFDYEVPNKAAIDFLVTLPGVDDRIALTGWSHGGYFACRVAIYDKRIKAVIPNSPLIDNYKATQAFAGPIVEKMPKALVKTMMAAKMKNKPVTRAFIEYMLWSAGFGGQTLLDFLTSDIMKKYTVANDLHKITCAALGLVGEDEGEELVNQAKAFVDGVSSKVKKLHIFTAAKDGSVDHCQLDNRSRGNQVMYDWLNEVFDYKYESDSRNL